MRSSAVRMKKRGSDEPKYLAKVEKIKFKGVLKK